MFPIRTTDTYAQVPASTESVQEFGDAGLPECFSLSFGGNERQLSYKCAGQLMVVFCPVSLILGHVLLEYLDETFPIRCF